MRRSKKCAWRCCAAVDEVDRGIGSGVLPAGLADLAAPGLGPSPDRGVSAITLWSRSTLGCVELAADSLGTSCTALPSSFSLEVFERQKSACCSEPDMASGEDDGDSIRSDPIVVPQSHLNIWFR